MERLLIWAAAVSQAEKKSRSANLSLWLSSARQTKSPCCKEESEVAEGDKTAFDVFGSLRSAPAAASATAGYAADKLENEVCKT